MNDPERKEFGSLVGGRLCLDFVNTVRARMLESASDGANSSAESVLGERLLSYDALLRWGVLAGALESGEADELAREAGERPAEAAEVLKRSVALREATYRIFRAAIDGGSPAPDDMVVLDSAVRIARTRERLVARGPFPLEWEWNAKNGALDRVLWPVARSAAELLTSGDLERVGQCPGEECGWLFLDTSRSGRRRWCSMADCGNIAKVRRFRERQRGEAD